MSTTNQTGKPRAYFSTRESAKLFIVSVKLARLDQQKTSHETAIILRQIADKLDNAEIIVSNVALSHGSI